MNTTPLKDLLHSLSSSSFPILGMSYQPEDYAPLNLSISNPDLETVNVSEVRSLGAFVSLQLQKQHAKVAYGGYLETRGIYQRSGHFNQKDPNKERNIHIGLDLWIDAGVPIHAPLDGRLHSFKNNTNIGDYGPTIIIEHHIEGVQFYTLYGHLSTASLKDKKEGDTIKKGEIIATLGDDGENGNYPPHLHFQIIEDLQGNHGDYPGVTNKIDLEFYKTNCPDSNLLLGL